MPNEVKILLEDRPEGAGFVRDRTKDGTRYYSHPDYSGLVFRTFYGSDGSGDDGALYVTIDEPVTDEQVAALTTTLETVFFVGTRFGSQVRTVRSEGTEGVTWFRSVDGTSF